MQLIIFFQKKQYQSFLNSTKISGVCFIIEYVYA